ncbi:MAG TPA: hypothetical protein PLP01_04760 [Phycisphaerae bacterium]|nr:HEAT repeat domain-containing protein [Phycisphaerae bacterium]HOI54536.1 hypothetical protein [Phycisphaerae bacterium]
MGDGVRLIECAQCGRLHEIAAGEKPGTCECGTALKEPHEAADSVSAPADVPAPGQAPAEETPSSPPLHGILYSALHNWKVLSAAATLAIVVILAAVFVRWPSISLAGIRLDGSGGAAVPRVAAIDIEAQLSIIADNSRAKEHLAASAILLQSRQEEALIARLSELVMRQDLASRKLMIQMLGQLGDDRALAVLEKLFADSDATIGHLAVSAVATIDSPSAESMLRRHCAQPDRARQMMPAVATARTRTSARVMASCLRRPELCDQAIQEIRNCRVEFCVPDLGSLAADRRQTEQTRLVAVEALGTLGGREAHKALADLLEDSVVGWKARQVLEGQGGR